MTTLEGALPGAHKTPESAAEAFDRLMDAEDFWEGALLDPGNVFKIVGYFVQVPTVWRRFFFRVLSPRDIAVYLYVCSYVSTQRSARATMQTIADDLGVTNRHGVADSLKRLEQRGFLIRKKMAVMNISRHPRYIYQRPSIAYTLERLLSLGLINGFFNPTRKTLRKGQKILPGHREARLGKPWVEPLKSIIGEAGFTAYGKLPNEPGKRQFLIQQFAIAVQSYRTAAAATPTEPKTIVF